jgi:uncharacterized protein YdbL (DUF1318 family)
MMHCKRSAVGAVALAAFVAGSAWAEKPASQRQKAERQIAKVEQKLANVQPDAAADALATQINLEQAKFHLDLAQQLLSHNNPKAATLAAEQAERSLTSAEGREVKQ